MADVTLVSINNAIEVALSAAPGIVRSQSYNELTEGIHDVPLLQVYWDDLPLVDSDSTPGQTDRMTFGGENARRQYTLVYFADLYAASRKEIGEDMGRLLPIVDEFITILESQTCPPFGVEGVKSFQWSAKRVTFEYNKVKYVGARFTLYIRLF